MDDYQVWKSRLQQGAGASRPIRPTGTRAQRLEQTGRALQAWDPMAQVRAELAPPPAPTIAASLLARFPIIGRVLGVVVLCVFAILAGLLVASAFGWKPTPSAFPHFVVWLCGAFGIGAIGHAIIYGWDRLSISGKLSRFGLLLVSGVLLLIFAPRDHSHTTIFSPVPIGGDSERPAFDFYEYKGDTAIGCKVAGGRSVPLGSTKWCPVPVEQDHGGKDQYGLPLPTPEPAKPTATPRPQAEPKGAAPADCRHKVYGKCPKAASTPAPQATPTAAAPGCSPAYRTSRGECY